MNNDNLKLQKLLRYNAHIGNTDPQLATEAIGMRKTDALRELAPSSKSVSDAIVAESIIMRTHRPVLRILQNETELTFDKAVDSKTWKDRLEAAADKLDSAIRAVGRINLERAPYEWVGTGWLVARNVMVTNRHVAELFAENTDSGLTFLTGADGSIDAEIDFLQEFESSDTRAFNLIRPLLIVEKPGPDMAFFEVEQTGGTDQTELSNAITLATQIGPSNSVATIGYPAFDSRIPDIDLMEQIYGSAYNKKRLAPGAVTAVDDTKVLHNCTTLGGNSGSVVLDLQSGEALGLHFSGAFMRTNYAVRADVVSRALEDVLEGRRPRPPRNTPNVPSLAPAHSSLPQSPEPSVPKMSTGQATVTLPLTISVSIGSGEPATTTSFPSPHVGLHNQSDDDDAEDLSEARPEDYRNRDGYQPDFLGDKNICSLPKVVRDASDVLTFEFDGKRETELRYQHFSVLMKRSRRLCYFSAVNINGARTVSAKRVRWKWDPRITKPQQIMKECYGRPPKFSRGHMTRRNDPSWGTSAEAKRGNRDSMHVTNAAPQMQAFNAPIWLELEDYALENAIEDDMKISVFTGPVFSADDPVYHGVQVPVSFWKIIAFIHDHTRELSATGYRMDQRQSLPSQDEFVFGPFTSSRLGIATQVPIRSIETATGLDFGGLADRDPLSIQETIAPLPAPQPLLSRHQIRFV